MVRNFESRVVLKSKQVSEIVLQDEKVRTRCFSTGVVEQRSPVIDLTSLEARKVSGTAGIESTKNCRGISRALVCCTGLGMLVNRVHLVINCQLFVWMHQFFIIFQQS